MLKTDLHLHTHFSNCGLHSILEVINQAINVGLEIIAITDHGPALGGRVSGVFFERFNNPYKEITVFKGLELNLTDKPGETDLPLHLLPFLDVILVGIHPTTPQGLTKDEYTDMLIKVIQNNKYIDIISHPNSKEYPLDFEKLAKEASKFGVALELNNSKTHLKRVDDKITKQLITACINNNCQMVINSDSHAITEIGNGKSVKPFLKELNFPDTLLLNSDVEKVRKFIQNRKNNKVI